MTLTNVALRKLEPKDKPYRLAALDIGAAHHCNSRAIQLDGTMIEALICERAQKISTKII